MVGLRDGQSVGGWMFGVMNVEGVDSRVEG